MNKKKITISLFVLALFAGAGLWVYKPALNAQPGDRIDRLHINKILQLTKLEIKRNGENQQITVAGNGKLNQATTYKIYISYSEMCDCPRPKKVEYEVGNLSPRANRGFELVKDLPMDLMPPVMVKISISKDSKRKDFDLGEAKFVN